MKGLWQKIGIHKQKYASEKERSFKKLDNLQLKKQASYDYLEPCHIQNISSVKAHDQPEFYREKTIHEDMLFQNFYEQYKKEEEDVEIVAAQEVNVESLILQSKIDDDQKDAQSEHQKNIKEMEQLINRLRENSHDSQQNIQIRQILKDKLMKANKLNMAEIKHIISDLFSLLRNKLSQLKTEISKQKQLFDRGLQHLTNQIEVYIDMRRLLSQKDLQNRQIQTSGKLGNNQKTSVSNMQTFDLKISINEKDLQIERLRIELQKTIETNKVYEFEKELFQNQIESLKTNIKSLKRQLSQQNSKIHAQYQKQMTELHHRYEGILLQKEEKAENMIEQSKIKYCAIIDDLRHQIGKLQTELTNMRVNKRNSIRSESSDFTKQLQELSTLFKRREQELSEQIQNSERRLGQALLKLRERQDQFFTIKTKQEKQIELMKKQSFITLQENFTLQQKIESFQFQLAEQITRAKKKQRREVRNEIQSLQSQIQDLKHKLDSANFTIQQLKSRQSNQLIFESFSPINRINSQLDFDLSYPKFKVRQHLFKDKQTIRDSRSMTKLDPSPVTKQAHKNREHYIDTEPNNHQQIFTGIYKELKIEPRRETFNPAINVNKQIKSRDQVSYKPQLKQQHKRVYLLNRDGSENQAKVQRQTQKGQFNKISSQLEALTKQLKSELESVNRNKR